jgi:hypothetical protein
MRSVGEVVDDEHARAEVVDDERRDEATGVSWRLVCDWCVIRSIACV